MAADPPLRIVLLRPPRYVWPFNSETSAFWQPLGLLCLAAAVRRDLPEAHVEVWDAPGEKCGWRTLRQRLAEQRIDVLGIGEETVSAHEAFRAADIVRQLHPECVIVAGGTYFAHTIESTLQDGRIDVVVRGEGEETFVELLRRIRDRDAWSSIEGIAFRVHPETLRTDRLEADPTRVSGRTLTDARSRIVITPLRRLIRDLDTLPLPAYDLIDMSRYGRGSRNHPGLVSIEHSRGCIDTCSFCILWKHMGESVNGNGSYRPRLRTKSPQRSFEEVCRLYSDFDRRTFGWVDPTFNASPEWSDGWAELMLGSTLMGPRGRARTLHTAWLRADGVVRDEKLGILDKLVRAGLHQVMIGVERDDDAGLAALNKHHNGAEVCREAFAIFHEKYPQVYTIGTVIFGLPGDTLADLKRLIRCEYEFGMDYGFIMPLTPNPGTASAEQAWRDGRVANRDLASYNFHTPVCTTETLDLRALESVYWRCMLAPSRTRVRRMLRRVLLERDRRKRRVHWSLLKRGTLIAARSLLRKAARPWDTRPTLYCRRPSWYDK